VVFLFVRQFPCEASASEGNTMKLLLHIFGSRNFRIISFPTGKVGMSSTIPVIAGFK